MYRQFFVQWNHPHVYGEYIMAIQLQKQQAESSPCIWGVPEGQNADLRIGGIIPMYMGSTIIPKVH